MVAHVLGKSDLEEWCDLCICNLRERLENLCWRANFLHMRILWVFLVSLLCYVFYNVCRSLFMHIKLVLEGGLAIQYGMVWATCMRGIYG